MREAQRAYDAALDGLYATFARYPFHAAMQGCPCCVDRPKIHAIGQVPLRKLDVERLMPLASHLLTTWGGVDDFKHVLPRLFELSTTHVLDWPSLEIVFGKLPYGEWTSWPAAEQQAVSRFIDVWWSLELDRATSGEPDGDEVRYTLSDCFAALCCLRQDPRPWLQTWLRDAVVSFATFVNQHYQALIAARRFNSFIDDDSVLAQIAAFLREPATRAALETACLATPVPAHAEILSLAEQLLTFR